jgi:hypothetical protein
MITEIGRLVYSIFFEAAKRKMHGTLVVSRTTEHRGINVSE